MVLIYGACRTWRWGTSLFQQQEQHGFDRVAGEIEDGNKDRQGVHSMSQIPHQHRHSSHLDRNRSNFVKTPSSADFKVAPVPARPVEGLWEPP